MNNFPAMTEERRQLAALCKIEIKRWQAASESNPNVRYMVELMEMALAQLTAPPAPVLRVPDEKHYRQSPHGESSLWAMGWNECLAEVKRLNTQPAPPEASNEQ